jgi:hypothetical protein
LTTRINETIDKKMKQLQFSTTINCASCIRAVSPTLNAILGEGNWNVDTQNPDKILTVLQDNISQQLIIDALITAGYSCEPLQITA